LDGKLAVVEPAPGPIKYQHGREVPREGTVRLWDVAAAEKSLPVTIPCMADSQIGFVASGNLLVLNQDRLGVWDLETGKKVRDLPGKIVRFALPPARNWVVGCPRGGVGQDAAPMSVLDPESGRVLGSLPGSGNWNRHVFSADGSRLTAVRQVDAFAPPHG